MSVVDVLSLGPEWLDPDTLIRAFGALAVLGVADQDARAHGVDESLPLDQFAKVCLAEALLLERLAALR